MTRKELIEKLSLFDANGVFESGDVEGFVLNIFRNHYNSYSQKELIREYKESGCFYYYKLKGGYNE